MSNSAISHRKKQVDHISKSFLKKEFDCPCDHCDQTLISDELVRRLEKLRQDLGCPIQITSAYRCDSYQLNLKQRGYETAHGLSTHQLGLAVDIKTGKHTGEELERAAARVGFLAIGRGLTWIHVDMRDDRVRRWGYKA